MAKSLQFGHLGLDPIIITLDEAYILRIAHKQWSKLHEADRLKVVLIKPTTFVRRYGDHLSSVPKSIKGSVTPLLVDGQLVALCSSMPAAGSLDRKVTTETVIPIQPYLDQLAQRPATFNLGRHTYSGGPGSCWSCEYRIERLNPEGTLWDILASDEETGEFQSMGSHTLDTAQEYFDGVGFAISRDDWEAMGATFPAEDDEPACP